MRLGSSSSTELLRGKRPDIRAAHPAPLTAFECVQSPASEQKHEGRLDSRVQAIPVVGGGRRVP